MFASARVVTETLSNTRCRTSDQESDHVSNDTVIGKLLARFGVFAIDPVVDSQRNASPDVAR